MRTSRGPGSVQSPVHDLALRPDTVDAGAHDIRGSAKTRTALQMPWRTRPFGKRELIAECPGGHVMDQDRTHAIVEDIIEALAHGEVADSVDACSIERRDDGSVLEIDLGESDRVYIVSVTSFPARRLTR